MPMNRWEFSIVRCLAGGNTSATCLKMLVMRFADVWPAPLSLLLHFAAPYIILVIILILLFCLLAVDIIVNSSTVMWYAVTVGVAVGVFLGFCLLLLLHSLRYKWAYSQWRHVNQHNYCVMSYWHTLNSWNTNFYNFLVVTESNIIILLYLKYSYIRGQSCVTWFFGLVVSPWCLNEH